METFGESVGPNSQPGLRRSYPFDGAGLARSLVQGVMIARGGQIKTDQSECAVPAASEMIAIHTSQEKLLPEIRKIFRVSNAPATMQGVDCCEKIVRVVYQDESVRAWKKRIRNSDAYSCQSTVGIYSGGTLIPDVCAEKKRKHFQGYNTGDIVGFVEMVNPAMMWSTTRPLKEKVLGGRALKLTAAEQTRNLALMAFDVQSVNLKPPAWDMFTFKTKVCPRSRKSLWQWKVGRRPSSAPKSYPRSFSKICCCRTT